jgi:hypothetical protein
VIRRALRGSKAPVITGVTTMLAQSLNPLLNSKNKTMAMKKQAMIRTLASKNYSP